MTEHFNCSIGKFQKIIAEWKFSGNSIGKGHWMKNKLGRSRKACKNAKKSEGIRHGNVDFSQIHKRIANYYSKSTLKLQISFFKKPLSQHKWQLQTRKHQNPLFSSSYQHVRAKIIHLSNYYKNIILQNVKCTRQDRKIQNTTQKLLL